MANALSARRWETQRLAGTPWFPAKMHCASENKANRRIWSLKRPAIVKRGRNLGRSHSLGPRVEVIGLKAGGLARHRECRTLNMTNTNSKFVTRFLAVLFVGLTFAGCAMMFVQGEKSLFAESQTTIP